MGEANLAVRKSIADSLRDIEIADTEAWSELDVLSNRTIIEAIEVFEDEIKIRENAFEGLFNIHCQLSYGHGAAAFTLSETFPGRFEGHLLEGGEVDLERVMVDTSGFRL
jgi:hypothetical protein